MCVCGGGLLRTEIDLLLPWVIKVVSLKKCAFSCVNGLTAGTLWVRRVILVCTGLSGVEDGELLEISAKPFSSPGFCCCLWDLQDL